MATLKFETEAAYLGFWRATLSVCGAIEEVSDVGAPRLVAIHTLMEVFGANQPEETSFPAALPFPGDLVDLAREIFADMEADALIGRTSPAAVRETAIVALPTITIASSDAHSIWHSMCEGMWEVSRDDNVSPTGDEGNRARRLEALIGATPGDDGTQYPATFTLPGELLEDARGVLENIEDSDDDFVAGEIVIGE